MPSSHTHYIPNEFPSHTSSEPHHSLLSTIPATLVLILPYRAAMRLYWAYSVMGVTRSLLYILLTRQHIPLHSLYTTLYWRWALYIIFTFDSPGIPPMGWLWGEPMGIQPNQFQMNLYIIFTISSLHTVYDVPYLKWEKKIWFLSVRESKGSLESCRQMWTGVKFKREASKPSADFSEEPLDWGFFILYTIFTTISLENTCYISNICHT